MFLLKIIDRNIDRKCCIFDKVVVTWYFKITDKTIDQLKTFYFCTRKKKTLKTSFDLVEFSTTLSTKNGTCVLCTVLASLWIKCEILIFSNSWYFCWMLYLSLALGFGETSKSGVIKVFTLWHSYSNHFFISNLSVITFEHSFLFCCDHVIVTGYYAFPVFQNLFCSSSFRLT